MKSVSGRLIDDLMKQSQSDQTLGQAIVTLMKPRVVEALEDQVERYVETGDFNRANKQPEAGKFENLKPYAEDVDSRCYSGSGPLDVRQRHSGRGAMGSRGCTGIRDSNKRNTSKQKALKRESVAISLPNTFFPERRKQS
ncbi:MAG TPA: hypothetical protein VHQ94_09755 [Pyrinomonadaceae bacterium]|jgi:hypothetical protein|nr:hypothetical protein [Pyrinomonadaceae bacterium]